MKLTPQEKRIVEICKNPKMDFFEAFHAVRKESRCDSVNGLSLQLIGIISTLSHSLEARAKRKGRVKAVRGWVGHDHHGFGRELYRASDEDLRVRWLGKARAILTISLPRKVRGK